MAESSTDLQETMGTEGAAAAAKRPSIPINTSVKIQNLKRSGRSVRDSDPLGFRLRLPFRDGPRVEAEPRPVVLLPVPSVFSVHEL